MNNNRFQPIRSSLRVLFIEDIRLKLFSLAVALFLYSFSHSSQDGQRSVAVNLIVMLPPEHINKVLVSPIPPHVRLTLRGPRVLLDELENRDLGSIQVRLQGMEDSRIVLDPQWAKVPPGIRVEQIDPPILDLKWEDIVSFEIPVYASVVGNPLPGLVIKEEPSLEPPRVCVRGPQSEVARIQRARVEPIDLDGLDEGEHSVSLAVFHPSGRLVFEPSNVVARIEIVPNLVEKIFKEVQVAVLGGHKIKLFPPAVDVHLRCPPSIAQALKPEHVVPRIALSSGANGTNETRPVLVDVVLCNARVIPPEVMVR
ncbi:YbbR-like domain-containing protein [Pajaroellobacter abortibovis]|uniref:YbbR-like domain-containing protein n=1 Tax=Pajaroellobacter abortibovis TaxID=1882918 RepID=A0A1L6MVY0_9BACT|nr:CdaR family protein [Pajaroellobacter abortibovis]APR99699.1 hypothetical protein BCY86_02680 [Pajaroellobacter abortibovis]